MNSRMRSRTKSPILSITQHISTLKNNWKNIVMFLMIFLLNFLFQSWYRTVYIWNTGLEIYIKSSFQAIHNLLFNPLEYLQLQYLGDGERCFLKMGYSWTSHAGFTVDSMQNNPEHWRKVLRLTHLTERFSG